MPKAKTGADEQLWAGSEYTRTHALAAVECVAHEAWHQSICGAMMGLGDASTAQNRETGIRMRRAQQTGLKCISTELQARPQSICGAVSGLDATAVHEYASRIRPARGGAHAWFECVAHYGHPQSNCSAERGVLRGSICGAVPEKKRKRHRKRPLQMRPTRSGRRQESGWPARHETAAVLGTGSCVAARHWESLRHAVRLRSGRLQAHISGTLCLWLYCEHILQE